MLNSCRLMKRMENTRFFDFRRFRAYDWLTLGYLAVWTILILFYYNRIPYAATLLFLHISGIVLSIILVGVVSGPGIPRLLQRWYPVLFLPLFFTVLHYLIPAIHSHDIDSLLVKTDLWLTGTYPTVWFEKFYHPLLTEIMQISYSTFYFLPLFILIPLYRQKRFAAFNRAAFVFLLAFYLSYLGYLVFPALGPRFFLAHLQQKSLSGYGFHNILTHTLNDLENIQWDAFPSGHVTIALLVAYFSLKFYPRMFYGLAPVIFLLVISTIYLRYHYLVDVLAGIVLFALVLFFTSRLRHYYPNIFSQI